MDDLQQRLSVSDEELRVADEEMRTQQELIDDLLRGRTAEQLAAVRLAAALPVPLVDTDKDGLVLMANPAAAALLHVDAGMLRGKPLAAFVDAADRRALRTALARATGAGEIEHLTVVLTPRREDSVPADLVVLPGTGEAADGTAPAAHWVLAPRRDAGAPADADLLTALGALSAVSVVDGNLHAGLSRIAGLAVQGLPAAVAAGIVLGPPGEPTLLVSTGQLAQVEEGAQLRAGEGPTWDAYGTGVAVVSATLSADDRWPDLGRLVPTGADGAVAVPLLGTEGAAGVLVLYGARGLADPDQALRVGLFAEAATALLREYVTVTELRRQEAQLRDALTSRAVIDQAKGILMAQHGLTPDGAFEELARRSQRLNVKLREVAWQLVDDVSKPHPVQPVRPRPPAPVLHPARRRPPPVR
jgi:hypothetical protein